MNFYFKEEFLHFLWENKLFVKDNLQGAKGEHIEIISVGQHNKNSGPDFFNAQIKIDEQLWAGNVEIHIQASDWFVHHHEKDATYDSVILHVVWNDDVPVFGLNNQSITTLVLKDYVSKELLENYHNLFLKPKQWINCEKEISSIDLFTLQYFKEQLYFDRIASKVAVIEKLLEKSKKDWEAVLFQLLVKSFGLKVNGESFLQLANTIPFSVVKKCSNSVLQLEALFFGIANMLDNANDSVYLITLKKEYAYLKKKFNLQNEPYNIYPQFFRLRPNNFPTIRLSQLANLYHLQKLLFSKITSAKELNDYYAIFNVGVSTFWETHYTFNATSKKSTKKISKSFIDLLLINTIIPLQVAYKKHLGNFDTEEVIALISAIKSENNSVLKNFKEVKITSKNAMDSQALIHLYTNYCKKDKCLQCVIGNKVLKK